MPKQVLDLKSEGGYFLAEALIGVLILTLALIPMLDLTALINGISPMQRKIALNLASGKIEDLGGDYYYKNNQIAPPTGSGTVTVGRYSYVVSYTANNYSPPPVPDGDYPSELTRLTQVAVTVRCQNCGKFSPTVKVVALLVHAG